MTVIDLLFFQRILLYITWGSKFCHAEEISWPTAPFQRLLLINPSSFPHDGHLCHNGTSHAEYSRNSVCHLSHLQPRLSCLCSLYSGMFIPSLLYGKTTHRQIAAGTPNFQLDRDPSITSKSSYQDDPRLCESTLNLPLRVASDSDKRSGIYYKPFGRQEPVIIRSPDAIQELSEAPELSQRAVYSDVGHDP